MRSFHWYSGIAAALLIGSGTVSADPAKLPHSLAAAQLVVEAPAPMGSSQLQPDSFTKLTGWEFREGLYFGKRSGEHSGLAFIWQPSADDQLSFSTRGFRFVRRF